jgi:hypothetical protein
VAPLPRRGRRIGIRICETIRSRARDAAAREKEGP